MNQAAAPAYYQGLNEKLLAAIPRESRHVLEFGCAAGRLGEAGKRNHPGLRWTGVDISEAALAEAAPRLDAVIPMDLDAPDPSRLQGPFDVVVFGDVLEHLRDPESLLRLAHAVSAPEARLVCCIPNMAHASVIERMLAGDLCYDPMGLLDATHIRFLSRASTYKLLLDAGWLPNLTDLYPGAHENQGFVQHLVAAAQQLGIPPNTAIRNILSYQLIIDCVKTPVANSGRAAAPFSVVVPVNNFKQFDLNVARSPGLAEVGARIIAISGASNAAEALAKGQVECSTRWIVFCHQDVYFGRGTGRLLAELFGSIPDPGAQDVLVGFAGLGHQANRGIAPAGLVIDRESRFDHPDSNEPVSIDELAIAISRDTSHRIDPRLGWHLWATDLCLAARRRPTGAAARIARIPLFHNSYNDNIMPQAFHDSARLLGEKYRGLGIIPTLCGNIAAPR